MERYCVECGCEILSDDDLGYKEVENETSAVMPGLIAKIERPFLVCRACKEEAERKLINIVDMEIEAAFDAWAKTAQGDIIKFRRD